MSATTVTIKWGYGTPADGSLRQGELAIDLTDESLWTADKDGNIVLVGHNTTDIEIEIEQILKDLAENVIYNNKKNDVVEGTFQIAWDDSSDPTYPFNGRIGYNKNASDPNSLDGSFLYVQGVRGKFSIGRDGDVELHGASEIQGIPDQAGARPWITGFSYVDAEEFRGDGAKLTGITTDQLVDVNSGGAARDDFLIYNGSTWVAEGFHIDTELTYQGAVNLTAPMNVPLNNGDLYVNNTAGVVHSSWAGIGGVTVREGNFVGYAASKARWFLLGDIASGSVTDVSGGLGIDVDDSKPAQPVVSVDRAEVDTWYEPKFSKLSAFNKNFGSTAGTVAEGNHNHAGLYEPAFTKNTAFNKNFGTAAGTVSEGNHSHSQYVNLWSSVANGISYSSGKVGIGLTNIRATLDIEGLDYTGAPTKGTSGTLGLTSGSAAGSGGSISFGAKQNYEGFAAIKGYLTSGSNNSAGHLDFYTRKTTTDAAMTRGLRLSSTGNAIFSGSVTASSFEGDGSKLTGIAAGGKTYTSANGITVNNTANTVAMSGSFTGNHSVSGKSTSGEFHAKPASSGATGHHFYAENDMSNSAGGSVGRDIKIDFLTGVERLYYQDWASVLKLAGSITTPEMHSGIHATIVWNSSSLTANPKGNVKSLTKLGTGSVRGTYNAQANPYVGGSPVPASATNKGGTNAYGFCGAASNGSLTTFEALRKSSTGSAVEGSGNLVVGMPIVETAKQTRTERTDMEFEKRKAEHIEELMHRAANTEWYDADSEGYANSPFSWAVPNVKTGGVLLTRSMVADQDSQEFYPDHQLIKFAEWPAEDCLFDAWELSGKRLIVNPDKARQQVLETLKYQAQFYLPRSQCLQGIFDDDDEVQELKDLILGFKSRAEVKAVTTLELNEVMRLIRQDFDEDYAFAKF